MLRNPAWSHYGIEELCEMGLKGVRGMRPGAKKARRNRQIATAQTKRMIREEAKLKTVTESESLDLLKEFF